jgi:hypothetical protein
MEPPLDLGPQRPKDDPFTARMRRHQSHYRAVVLGVPCGTGPRPGSPKRYGNMLTSADAARGLNFLSPEIHAVALARLAERRGTVEPFRLLHNLLSSMPMCFNLFGPLVADRELATRCLRSLLGGEVAEVTDVRLEYAPAPAADYLDDRTAFDAFLEYRRPDGARCMLGVETKLTDRFSSRRYSRERPAYRRWLGVPGAPWLPEALPKVDRVEHNQLFRDHLLAVAMVARPGSPYAAGRFLLIRHDEDVSCAVVTAGYRRLLRSHDDTFLERPLSRVVAAWTTALDAAREPARVGWLAAFRRRYLELAASERFGAAERR